jgi:serine/threonine protein phosphatase 1
MLRFLKRKLHSDEGVTAPSIGPDRRVYAIGDIHGRADLFACLLGMVADDDAARDRLPLHIILLGDLVDRGPRSAQVVADAMALSQAGGHVRFIKGNHEEVFVMAARGDPRAARFFCRIGGVETLASYGLDEADCAAMEDDAIARWMLAHIPRAHVDFIDGFEDMIEMGDYLFVHAGIRPRVPLDAQDPNDLRWIRGEFLDWDMPLGKMVVHGHSITEAVDERSNRIGIDTGAYYSNRLTAIGLQADKRWFLSTAD